MKTTFRFLLVFLLTASTSSAQSNWSALLPAQFPTNASGQIHGISRVSQMKFHPTNSNKMYAISARGGLFITSNAGANWSVAPGTDFMPSDRLASVCIDFTNDQVIYLGTGDHDYYYSGSGVWTVSIHIFEPTGPLRNSYSVLRLKKKKKIRRGVYCIIK